MPGDKGTMADIEERITKMLELHSNGMPKQDIFRFVSKTYRVTMRTCDNYWKRVTAEINKLFSGQREDMINATALQLEKMFFEAWRKDRYSESLMAIKERNSLLGLTAVKRQELLHKTIDNEGKPVGIIILPPNDKQ